MIRVLQLEQSKFLVQPKDLSGNTGNAVRPAQGVTNKVIRLGFHFVYSQTHQNSHLQINGVLQWNHTEGNHFYHTVIVQVIFGTVPSKHCWSVYCYMEKSVIFFLNSLPWNYIKKKGGTRGVWSVTGRIRTHKTPRIAETASPDRQFSESDNSAWQLPAPSTVLGN